MKRKLKQFWETKKGGITIISLVIVLTLVLQLLLTFYMSKRGIYPDATPEGLYTVTESMETLCGALKGEVLITFCDDPDHLLNNYATRYVYIMVQQLAQRFDHIRYETVNVRLDPTAVYQYRTTSASVIEPDDVIISSGGRYRVYAADKFWTKSSEDQTDRFWSYNGEYVLATAMLSVTAITQPYVYFVYGHGEEIYVDEKDEAYAHLLPLSTPSLRGFYDWMLEQGLKVGYLSGDDLKKVPDDCVLLVMNNPKEDYVESDIYALEDNGTTDAIHRYLAEKNGAFMLFLEPGRHLPQLEQFVSPWGIAFTHEQIKDTTNQTGKDTLLWAEYNRSEDEMSYGVYADIADMPNPPRFVMDGSGSVKTTWKTHEGATSSTSNVTAYYSPFLYSAPTAYSYNAQGNLTAEKPRAHELAGLSVRIKTDSVTTDSYFSYVFASACPAMVTDEWLTSTAYGNHDAMFALVRYISRTDEYASMDLGGTSLNSLHMGGKPLVYSEMTDQKNVVYENGMIVKIYEPFTNRSRTIILVFTLVLPVLLVASVGAVVYLRRRR